MKLRLLTLLASIALIGLLTISVSAHVPVAPEPGETLDTAVKIENPTKSWVIYSDLHEGAEPHYFHFEIEQGARIRLKLMIPINHDPSEFRPVMALMGPGLTNEGVAPSYLETPESGGVVIVESGTPNPEYEGFTPTSFLAMAAVDITAPEAGAYYLAVYEPSSGGRFAVAVGYIESFGLDEWLLVPFSVMIIHQWNGQSLLVILSPLVGTMIAGLAYLLMKREDLRGRSSLSSWLAITGGLTFVASGITILVQMVVAVSTVPANPQVVVTVAFAMIPLLLGAATLRIALREDWQLESSAPMKLLVFGAIAPFAWAGLLVGPGLVIISGLIILLGRRQRQSDI
ncbi:MAG: hypothetical protein ACXADS_02945 [Candidatus Thorarchaeota archaeon]|jgi:hypothetical protein